MSKHTPGPWAVVHERPEDSEWVPNPWGEVQVADKRYVTVEGRSANEAAANARLIAAAPDLLAACKEALGFLTDIDRDAGVIGATLRKAILKAEGRS